MAVLLALQGSSTPSSGSTSSKISAWKSGSARSSCLPTPRRLSSEVGIAEISEDTVLEVEESPRAKRARATTYTTSIMDATVSKETRQRNLTWTQVTPPPL
jgi:hypothetical protein